MKSTITKFIQINPSFVILAGLLNGIFSLLFLPQVNFFYILVYLVCSSLLLLFISKKVFAKFAIFSILGLLLVKNSMSPPANHYSHWLPDKSCGAQIEVKVLDATAVGGNVDWLPIPKLVKAEVLRFRYSPVDSWHDVSGRTLLRFSGNTSNVTYGDVLEVSGYFSCSEPVVVKGGFKFSNYLKSLGVSNCFIIDKNKPIINCPHNYSFTVKTAKIIFGIRDSLLNGISEGMELKYRRMLAAILFGCRQGLNYASSSQFKQSGVMHIFAISGLHVGILALTLYLLFCWVPFRTRHLIIPLFLFIYVLTTGLQASAIRAFLMIAIWSLHRASLKSISVLNAVFLAATMVLLWNPLALLGTGFQYSFIIAGFLIISWQSIKRWLTCLNEKNLWNPDYGKGLKFRLHQVRNTSLNSFFSSFIAWSAGSGLNLIHGNLFIPGATFANFIILPFVWLLFLTAAFSLILLPLRHLLHTGFILEFLLKIINSLSSAGADWGGGLYLAPPPIWMVILFFTGLLMLVTAKKKWIFMTASVLLVSNVLFWYAQPLIKQYEGRIVMLHGRKSQIPGFIFLSEDKRRSLVINVGSQERARVIMAFLRNKGVNTIDTLCLSKSSKDVCDGAWFLFSGLQFNQVIFPGDYRRSEYAKYVMQQALKSGAAINFMHKETDKDKSWWQYKDPVFAISRQNKGYTQVKIKTPNTEFRADIRKQNPGNRKVSIKLENKEKSWILENSNKLKLYSVD